MVTKLSFPRMGWSKIAFNALYDLIPGVEVVSPPPVTRDIVELGSKYSPEFVQLQFSREKPHLHEDVHALWI